MSEIALDPIRFEVIRNRLIAVTEEMRIALQSVSGSPTVTEATDFFTGIFLPDGTFATMGFQVTLEAPTVGGLIRHLLNKPGQQIAPGDMFVGNDPYIGALHQNDLQMAGPIFDGDELVAWAGVMAHETDMGGMDFASWSPTAREIYQEGIRIPGVKLVDGGEVRDDVLEFILAASRLPAELGLDIRAFIATLNVAGSRMRDLVDHFRRDQVMSAMRTMIEVSDRRMRERLLELSDAEVRVADFLEHDGHRNELYKVDLHLTKREDRLTLDFSGSSRQAPGFINATRAGLVGGVVGSVIPTLGWDLSWNEGLMGPVEIVAPDGLICTAQHPVPVGAATVETIWVVMNVVASALSPLLACSEDYRDRAQAVSCGTMATFNMGGVRESGEPFGLHLLDPIAGGFGAWASRDGVDAGGPICTPMPAIADVEANELVKPILYLYRRLGRDTAGAGTYRGGRGGEIALTVSGVRTALALIMTHGREVPNSQGRFGGWPGATVRQQLGRGALPEGRLPKRPPGREPAELGGEWEELGPKPGRLPMSKEDVFAVSWQGGGGWGDPIRRDPAAVAADLRDGVISPGAATEVYGVAVDDGEVDAAATNELRDRILGKRLATRSQEPETLDEGVGETLGWIGPSLRLVRTGDDVVVVSRGGAVLARNTTAWRAGAIKRSDTVVGYGPMTLHDRLTISCFFCPASGELLSVDVHERDQEPVDDLLLDLARFAAPKQAVT